MGGLAGLPAKDRVSENLVEQKFNTAAGVANSAYSAAMSALSALAAHTANIGVRAAKTIPEDGPDVTPVKTTRPADPTLNVGDITDGIIPPDLPDLSDLDFSDVALPGDRDLDQEMVAVLKARLIPLIQNGGTGLDPEVEQAIWDRAKERIEAENEQAFKEATEGWAARGFAMPPGMLAGAAMEARDRASQKLMDLNNDILIQSSELAQKVLFFSIESGISLQGMINQVFTTLWQGDIALFDAQIRKAIADVEAQASLFGASRNVYDAMVRKYAAELDARTRKVTADLDAQVRVAGLKAQYYDAEGRRYAAELDAKIRSFLGEVEAGRANLEADGRQMDVEARVAVAEMDLRSQEMQAIMRVAAQMCAAAMTAVSASASLGFSETFNTNASWSDSLSEAYNHNYFHSEE